MGREAEKGSEVDLASKQDRQPAPIYPHAKALIEPREICKDRPRIIWRIPGNGGTPVV